MSSSGQANDFLGTGIGAPPPAATPAQTADPAPLPVLDILSAPPAEPPESPPTATKPVAPPEYPAALQPDGAFALTLWENGRRCSGSAAPLHAQVTRDLDRIRDFYRRPADFIYTDEPDPRRRQALALTIKDHRYCPDPVLCYCVACQGGLAEASERAPPGAQAVP